MVGHDGKRVLALKVYMKEEESEHRALFPKHSRNLKHKAELHHHGAHAMLVYLITINKVCSIPSINPTPTFRDVEVYFIPYEKVQS